MAANEQIRELRDEAKDLYDRARDGGIEKGTAAVLVQIMHVRIRLVEVESAVAKEEELERRIEELEGQASRRWVA